MNKAYEVIDKISKEKKASKTKKNKSDDGSDFFVEEESKTLARIKNYSK